jgi:hypothetical protein
MAACVRGKGRSATRVFNKEAENLELLLAGQLKSSDVRCIRLSLRSFHRAGGRSIVIGAC